MKNKWMRNSIIAAIVLSMCGTPVAHAQSFDSGVNDIQISVDEEVTVEETSAPEKDADIMLEEELAAPVTEDDFLDTESDLQADILISDEDVQLPVVENEETVFTDTTDVFAFSSGEDVGIEEEVVEPAGDTVIVSVNFNAANFPDETFRKIIQKFDLNVDSVFSVEEIKAVTALDVSKTGIKDLKGIEYFRNLTELNCSWNGLTALDVSALENLTSLNCGLNRIEKLDVSNLKKLRVLNCEMNQLKSLIVTGAESLEVLACGTNSLAQLNVSGLKNLQTLYCFSNKITDLNLTNLTQLEVLICNGNPIKKLSLKNLVNLREVNVGGLRIVTEDSQWDSVVELQELDLTGAINIEKLKISDAKFKGMNLTRMPKLKSLILDSVTTPTLNLSNMAVLDELVAQPSVYATLIPSASGWRLDLNDFLGGVSAGSMELVSWTEAIPNGEKNAVIRPANTLKVDGQYLLFETAERPIALKYKWHTGSGDNRVMNVDVTLNLSSIQLGEVALKSPILLDDDSTKLTWNRVPGASGYNVYQLDETTKKWNVIATLLTGDSTSFTVSSLKIGETKRFTVGAYAYTHPDDPTKVVNGPYNKSGVAITQGFSTAPVEITSAKCSNATTNMIAWTKRAKADGFIVYRKTGNGSWEEIATVDKAVYTYKDTKCSPATSYSYMVKAYVKAVSGTYYSKYKESDVVVTKPQSAKLGTVTITDEDAIEITWTAPKTATGCVVYKKTGDSGWVRVAVCGKNVSSYVDTDTVFGETYTYTVRSYVKVNGKTVWGNYSSKGLTVSRDFGNSIVNIEAVKALNDGTVEVSWKKLENSTGYRIYRKTTGTSWKLVGRTRSALRFVDKTSEPGNLYYYTVRAYATYNKKTVLSKYQSGVSVVLRLARPVIIRAKVNSNDFITLLWDNVPYAENYVVYRRMAGGKWSRVAVIDAKRRYFIDKTAIKGKTYEYRIRAHSLSGTKNVYSSYSAISQKIKR